MSVNVDILTGDLVDAFTETTEVTEVNPSTGERTKKTETIQPSRDKMKKLAQTVLNHITSNAEIYQVNTNVSTTVNTTVAPGIPIASPAGPGATTGPGTGTGSGTGSGTQTGSGKIK